MTDIMTYLQDWKTLDHDIDKKKKFNIGGDDWIIRAIDGSKMNVASPVMGAWITFIPKKQKTSDNTRYEIRIYCKHKDGKTHNNPDDLLYLTVMQQNYAKNQKNFSESIFGQDISCINFTLGKVGDNFFDLIKKIDVDKLKETTNEYVEKVIKEELKDDLFYMESSVPLKV